MLVALLLASVAVMAAPVQVAKTQPVKVTWMQVEETVVPLRENTTRNAAILGFARKGDVLALQGTAPNWVRLRANDTLAGWVPLTAVTESGPPVNWNPATVKIILGVIGGAILAAFAYLAVSLTLRRKRESAERARQAIADARRRLQNKVQLLFRAEPHIPSHLMMDDVDLVQFLRNIGYVANLEKDPELFLASCKWFKPNMILAAAEFREKVESLVEKDAMLINTPVIYLRCDRPAAAPENRIRSYLESTATDRDVGEAIAFCLKKSPGKIRYSVQRVALKGLIQNGTLVEILHFLAAVKKTGQLRIASGIETGEILLHLGEVIGASMSSAPVRIEGVVAQRPAARLSGVLATEKILNLATGSFEFDEKVASHPTGSPLNTHKLLLDWARNRDENKHHTGP
jgi:hypothetical protein